MAWVFCVLLSKNFKYFILCMSIHMGGGWRTTLGSCFPPSTLVPGMELRSLGSSHGAILLALSVSSSWTEVEGWSELWWDGGAGNTLKFGRLWLWSRGYSSYYMDEVVVRSAVTVGVTVNVNYFVALLEPGKKRL